MTNKRYFTLEQAIQETEKVLQLRNYSFATRKSYLGCIRLYLKDHLNEINQPKTKEIENFLLGLYKKGLSAQTIQSYSQAIQFYYREVIGVEIDLQIQTPKRPQRLPVTLSRKEIDRI